MEAISRKRLEKIVFPISPQVASAPYAMLTALNGFWAEWSPSARVNMNVDRGRVLGYVPTRSGGPIMRFRYGHGRGSSCDWGDDGQAVEKTFEA